MTKAKRILYIALCTLVLVASMGSFSFADSLSPLPVLSATNFSTLTSEGVQLNSGSWWSLYAGSPSYNTADIYAGSCPNPDVPGYYMYYCASLAPSQGSYYSNSASSSTSITLRSQDSTTGVYYAMLTTGPNIPTSDCPLFSTLDDFLSFVANPVTSEVIPFSIDPGYALIVSGPCDILERNYSISGSWDYVRVSGSDYRVNGSVNRLLDAVNIRDGYSPDQGFSRDQMIQWNAVNANSQGVASAYSYTSSSVLSILSEECYVITYPEYLGIESVTGDDTVHFQNAVSFNGSLYVQYSGSRPSFRQVAIETVETWVGRTYSMYNVFRPNVYDETGEVTTDPSGDPVVVFPDGPSGGGNTGQPELNEDTSIVSLLRKFVEDVKTLLSSASQAISDLVREGSSFMQSVVTMFSWLPAPVTTVIFAGLIVLLVIGVVSKLWR